MKAIVTKYHPAGNTRGARISASAEGVSRLYLSYPHELSGEACHRAAAEALCDRQEWPKNLIGGGLPAGGYAFVFAPEPVKTLTVNGKYWCGSSYGSPYCTVSIALDGEHLASLGPSYGGQGMPEQLAAAWLHKHRPDLGFQKHEPLWMWRDRTGNKLNGYTHEVKREKDL